MDVVIIDYGAGNIKSLEFALQRLGLKALLSKDETTIRNADKVIFPGVGEASSAMLKLKASGLDQLIPLLEQPVLGICLGMQLMCNSSEENNTEGMGIFDVDVLRFSSKVKVPQIGWNEVFDLKSGLFEGISENEFLYSVHSFYAPVCEEMIATTHYELNYAAALQKDNFYGVQFHPEKSSTAGQRILQNFLDV